MELADETAADFLAATARMLDANVQLRRNPIIGPTRSSVAQTDRDGWGSTRFIVSQMRPIGSFWHSESGSSQPMASSWFGFYLVYFRLSTDT